MARTRRDLWDSFNLNYFRHTPPARLAKRWLYFGAPVLAVAWLLWANARGDLSPYSSGELSVSHALIAHDCARCHSVPFRRLHHLDDERKAAAMNENCLNCHEGTIGYDRDTQTAWHRIRKYPGASPLDAATVPAGPSVHAHAFALPCARCHTEHQGAKRLNVMGNDRCTQCHMDLRPFGAAGGVYERIGAFNERGTGWFPFDRPAAAAHPEFRMLAGKKPDPGRIKFNHRRHLATENYDEPNGLLGPDGGQYQLRCNDCHRAGRSNLPWRFGRTGPHVDERGNDGLAVPQLRGAYMDPINFTLHCTQCHPLSVGDDRDMLSGDETVPPGEVPHLTPAAIQTFLRGQLLAFINDDERFAAVARGADRTPPPILRDKTPQEVEALKLDWIEKEVRRIQDRLYARPGQNCQKCHDMASIEPGGAPALPRIVAPDIPMRWFANASFNHEKHSAVALESSTVAADAHCTVCHHSVRDSAHTTDVLLPGVESCRRCHGPVSGEATAITGGVSDHCVLCHSYHVPPADMRSHVIDVATKGIAP